MTGNFSGLSDFTDDLIGYQKYVEFDRPGERSPE